MAIDHTNQIMAQRIMLDHFGHEVNMTQIMNFKEGAAWDIYTSSQSCTRYSLNYPMMDRCVPEEAEYLGKARLGSAMSGQEVEAYKLNWRGNGGEAGDLMVNVDPTACVRVTMSVNGYDHHHDIGYQINQNFYDAKPGISDKTIFDLPEICKGARVSHGPLPKTMRTMLGY